eukprot:5866429-Prymnesium_polylepis.1
MPVCKIGVKLGYHDNYRVCVRQRVGKWKRRGGHQRRPLHSSDKLYDYQFKYTWDRWRNVSTMSGLTILADSTIAHSSATGTAGSGGAIEVAASLTITGSIFIGCSADQYGGAMYIRGGDLTATNVTIRGSSAQMGAGALYMTDGEVSFLTSTIVNSTTRTASACSARRSSSRSTRRCSGAPRWRGGAARRRSANGARRGPIRHRARHRRN